MIREVIRSCPSTPHTATERENCAKPSSRTSPVSAKKLPRFTPHVILLWIIAILLGVSCGAVAQSNEIARTISVEWVWDDLPLATESPNTLDFTAIPLTRFSSTGSLDWSQDFELDLPDLDFVDDLLEEIIEEVGGRMTGSTQVFVSGEVTGALQLTGEIRGYGQGRMELRLPTDLTVVTEELGVDPMLGGTIMAVTLQATVRDILEDSIEVSTDCGSSIQVTAGGEVDYRFNPSIGVFDYRFSIPAPNLTYASPWISQSLPTITSKLTSRGIGDEEQQRAIQDEAGIIDIGPPFISPQMTWQQDGDSIHLEGAEDDFCYVEHDLTKYIFKSKTRDRLSYDSGPRSLGPLGSARFSYVAWECKAKLMLDARQTVDIEFLHTFELRFEPDVYDVHGVRTSSIASLQGETIQFTIPEGVGEVKVTPTVRVTPVINSDFEISGEHGVYSVLGNVHVELPGVSMLDEKICLPYWCPTWANPFKTCEECIGPFNADTLVLDETYSEDQISRTSPTSGASISPTPSELKDYILERTLQPIALSKRQPSSQESGTGLLHADDGESSENVTLSWPASENPETYAIFRADPGRSYEKLATTLGSFYVDTDALAGRLYSYAVAEDSASSGWQSFQMEDTGWRALGAPTALDAGDGLVSDGISLSWTASDGAVSTYVVERASTVASYSEIGETISCDFLDNTTAVGQEYEYRVYAVAENGETSPISASDKGWRRPIPPEDVVISAGESASTIGWSPVAGAILYRITPSSSPREVSPISGLSPIDTKNTSYQYGYQVYRHAENGPIIFFVQALVGGQWSSLSTPAFYPQPEDSTSYSPFGFSGSQDLDLRIDASDGTNPDDVTVKLWILGNGSNAEWNLESAEGIIYRSQAIEGPYEEIGRAEFDLSLTRAEYRDLSAEPGLEYYYKAWVSLQEEEGGGLFSSEGDLFYALSTADVGCRELQPFDWVVIGPANEASIDVEWGEVPFATHYEVYRSEGNRSDFQHIGTTTETTYADKGDDQFGPLKPGTVYWYAVISRRGGNWTIRSCSSEVSGFLGFPCPSSVSASNSIFSHVDVQWSPVEGSQGFDIYRSTSSSGTPTKLAHVDGATHSYADGCEMGVRYYYSVRAIGPNGVESPLSISCDGIRQLGAPQNVRASTDNPAYVELSWDSVEGADHYIICWTDNPQHVADARRGDLSHVCNCGLRPGHAGGPRSDIIEIHGTSWQVRDGELGKTYYYNVGAVKSGYTATYSNFATASRHLGSPQNVQASYDTPLDYIRVAWDEVPGAAYYRVDWTDDDQQSFTLGPNITETSYDHYAAYGQRRWYRVYAFLDEDHWSPASPLVAGLRRLPTPQNVQASYDTPLDYIRVSWDEVPGAAYYRVDWTDDDQQSFALGPNITETSYDHYAAYGQRRWYRVYAFLDEDHWSPASPLVAGLRRLPAPLNVQASYSTPLDYIRVSWDEVPGAAYYRVDWTDDDQQSFTLGPNITETSYDHYAAYGQRRWYRVYAFLDEDHWSPASPLVAGLRRLPAPQNVQANDGLSGNCVEISFDPVEGATNYRAFRAESENGPFERLTDSSGNYDALYSRDGSAIRDETAEYGKVYWYQVYAGTAWNITSLPSAPDPGYRMLAMPQNVHASDDNPDYIEIHFDPVPEAKSYRAFRSESENGPFERLTDESGDYDALYSRDGSAIRDETAEYGKVYWYQVCAGTAWNIVSLPSRVDSGVRALAAPKNVRASNANPDNIEISWDPVADATWYKIWRSDSERGTYSHVDLDGDGVGDGNIGANGPLSWIDTSAEYGAAYWYKVQSRVGDYHSALSSADSGQRKSISPPQHVRVTYGIKVAGVEITWDPVADATWYKVWRSDSSGGDYIHLEDANVGADESLSWLDTSAEYGVTYWYKVESRIGDYHSELSSAVPGYRLLAAPTNVQATDSTFYDHVEVTWNVVADATWYKVWRSDSSGGDYIHLKNANIGADGALSWLDTSAEYGVTYWYKVQSRVGDYHSELSSADSGYRLLASPDNVQATDGTLFDSIEVSWDASDGAEWYKVFRGTSESGPFLIIDEASIAAGDPLVWHDTTAVYDTVYWYKIQPRNSEQFGYVGDQAPDSGYRVLPAPANIQATDGTLFDSIEVSWDASDGAGWYQVYRGLSEDGPFQPAEEGSVSASEPLSWQDTSAEYDTVYWYKVQPRNSEQFGYIGEQAPDSGYCTLPAPLNVQASDGSEYGHVEITWDAADGAGWYQVYRGVSEGGPFQPVEGGSVSASDPLTWHDTTADYDTVYWYKVQPRTSEVYGSVGDQKTDSGFRTLPAPTNVQATDGTLYEHIEVTWNASDGAEWYKVFRGTSEDGPFLALDEASIAANDPLVWPDTTADYDTVYWYKVQPRTSEVYGSVGGQTQDSGYRALLAPQNIQASGGTSYGHVEITWESADGATWYNVWRCSTRSGTYLHLEGANIGATEPLIWLDETATPGATYWYKVKSHRGDHHSALSAPCSGVRMALPHPRNVQATDGTSFEHIEVTWNASDGAGWYQVYRGLSESGPFLPVEGGSVPASDPLVFEDTETEYGTTYWYKVQPRNSEQQGSVRDQQPNDGSLGQLPTPALVSASDNTSTAHIEISWDKVDDATWYQVYRATSSSGSYSLVGNIDGADDSYEDEDALHGVKYWYKVRSRRGDYASELSSPDEGVRSLLPPDDVEATNNTSTEHVEITWDFAEGATWYQVYRATSSSGSYSLIADLDGNIDSYEDDDAEHGRPYYYKMRSRGLEHIASELSPSDDGVRSLDVPDDVEASDNTSTDHVKIEWDKVDDATWYQVYRATSSSGSYSLVGDIDGADDSYEDDDAHHGVKYWYKVRSRRGDFASELSSSDDGVRSLLPPDDVEASDNTDTGHIEITWDKADGATWYQVYRATSSSGSYSRIADIDGVYDYYEDDEAEHGRPYYYKVRSRGLEHIASELSPADEGVRSLLVPDDVEASDNTSTEYVEITWDKADDATWYQVYRATSSSGSYSKIADVDGSDDSYEDEDAEHGLPYYYKVRARRGAYASDLSSSDEGARSLLAPDDVKASDNTSTEYVEITWDKADDATWYQVYRATSSSGSYSKIADVDGSDDSYEDEDAVAGTPYWYKVRSRRGAYASELSSSDSGSRAP